MMCTVHDRYVSLSVFSLTMLPFQCYPSRLFHLPHPNYWTVVVGKYNLKVKEPGEVTHRISRIILHEDFREYHHDLALIKLLQPVKTQNTDFIKTICLPNTEMTQNETFEGLRCLATGWGRTRIGAL